MPSDCVKAMDETYKGIVDLTSKVVVGSPVEESAGRFKVPYDVRDDAGNSARVWREVVVDEVDLADLEHRIRADVMSEKQKEIDQAVNAAVEAAVRRERSNQRVSQCPDVATGRRMNPPAHSEQPGECVCSEQVDAANCEAFCQQRLASFTKESCPSLFTLLVALLPTSGAAATTVMAVVVFGVAILLLKFFVTLLHDPGAYFGRSIYFDEFHDPLQVPLQAQRGPPTMAHAGGPAPAYGDQYQDALQFPAQQQRGLATPRVQPGGISGSMSDPRFMTGRRVYDNGLFSPPENRMHSQGAENGHKSPFLSPSRDRWGSSSTGDQNNMFDDSIYQ